jgi:hypothetical protein
MRLALSDVSDTTRFRQCQVDSLFPELALPRAYGHLCNHWSYCPSSPKQQRCVGERPENASCTVINGDSPTCMGLKRPSQVVEAESLRSQRTTKLTGSPSSLTGSEW